MEESLQNNPALKKAVYYCRYQQRSHKEVKEKLYALGLYKSQVEEMLAWLIEQDYVNEDRFAKALVHDKFKFNKWGRIKIKYALKQKNISDYNIHAALSIINMDEYLNTMRSLLKNYKTAALIKSAPLRYQKQMNYLLQKGFEVHLIRQVLNETLI